jgi:hypothetical protein
MTAQVCISEKRKQGVVSSIMAVSTRCVDLMKRARVLFSLVLFGVGGKVFSR